MKTREEFIKKWLNHMVGWGMVGTVSGERDGALARAARIREIVDDAPRFLAMMYDDLNAEPAKTAVEMAKADPIKPNGVLNGRK